MWVYWFKEVILKGDLSNYWSINRSNKIVGNGEGTNFWFDNCLRLEASMATRLGIPKTATVASLHHNSRWLLPPRIENQLALQIFLTTVQLSERDDHYSWKIEGRAQTKYIMGEVYTYLKGDMLIKWGIIVDPLCLLCNANNESKDHLFFECSYTSLIWREIAGKCHMQPLVNWDDNLSMQGNRDIKRLTLIATQATIYWIWNERNSRLHRQTFKPPETIISTIDKQIRNRLQSFRQSNPRASSAMMQLWII
ncbi:hypothetical protein N665_0219s0007 [Sinapis alba]|nr:hypothetical protein N665_0219s0007 [Sinapis alba]